MNDIEALLQGAGERWRAAQPEPPLVDARAFIERRRAFPTAIPMAALATAAVVIVAVVTVQFGGRLLPGSSGAGGGPAPSESAAVSAPPSPEPSIACNPTKPVPAFVPPGGELTEPPPGHQWFGRAGLYTALYPEGEVWRGLPENPEGFTQKTVWWSVDWRPDEEPEPAIYVSGERLDAPGTFEFGPGTNATAPDIATAMMVGIDVPELGCWRITATYREARLYYDVLVTD
jgi:hypothetical protein